MADEAFRASRGVVTGNREVGDFSLLKTCIIGLLAAGLGGGSGYFFNSFNVFLGLLLLVAFGIVFTIQTLLVSSRLWLLILSLLESLAVALPFFKTLNVGFVGGWLLMFLIILLAALSARSEINNYFKIPFSRIAKTLAVDSLTAILLFVSIVYLGLGGAPSLSDKQFKSLIDAATADTFKLFVPVYDVNMKVLDVLTQGLSGTLLPDQKKILESASPEMRNQIIGQGTGEIQKSIEGFLGVPVDLESTVSDLVYSTIKDKVSKFSDDVKVVLTALLLLSLWIMFKTSFAFPLVYWPISFISYLLYQSLLLFGFAYIQLEMKNREVIMLK